MDPRKCPECDHADISNACASGYESDGYGSDGYGSDGYNPGQGPAGNYSGPPFMPPSRQPRYPPYMQVAYQMPSPLLPSVPYAPQGVSAMADSLGYELLRKLAENYDALKHKVSELNNVAASAGDYRICQDGYACENSRCTHVHPADKVQQAIADNHSKHGQYRTVCKWFLNDNGCTRVDCPYCHLDIRKSDRRRLGFDSIPTLVDASTQTTNYETCDVSTEAKPTAIETCDVATEPAPTVAEECEPTLPETPPAAPQMDAYGRGVPQPCHVMPSDLSFNICAYGSECANVYCTFVHPTDEDSEFSINGQIEEGKRRKICFAHLASECRNPECQCVHERRIDYFEDRCAIAAKQLSKYDMKKERKCTTHNCSSECDTASSDTSYSDEWRTTTARNKAGARGTRRERGQQGAHNTRRSRNHGVY